ncbi:P-loop containing nucleoside triphosphate hydrolase protein [Trametopsis cervina]|nr:P-loop containing nucleoside triphosphate hydrolase protein [Trametopsis cervina]
MQVTAQPSSELGLDSTNAVRMPADEPLGLDVFIAVMGATGSGKSSFINLMSGSSLSVGEGLRSCTSRIELGKTFELDGSRVTLVDTPGFDDTTVSDTEILKMISAYLSSSYQGGIKLSGVIYMHRISDIRIGGISRRNFGMFRKLCGDDSLKNVVIVTNMWGEVSREKGVAREEELKTDELLFKPVLAKGATMLRNYNTVQSARLILRQLLGNRPQALQLQRELVDEGRDITQTEAGVELDREMVALMAEHKKQIAEIRAEMDAAISRKDLETKAELDEVRHELEGKIQQLALDRERVSREYAVEKEKADEKMRDLHAELEVERQQRQDRWDEMERLMAGLEATNAHREEMQRRIDELEHRNSGPCTVQ